MEFQLGYGGAIHHFKNYVLRANDVNHTAALERLLRVQSLLGEMISSPRFNEKQKRDLDAFERVSHAYLEYLPLIERLIRMQRPVAQIDLAVKVNDEPAYAALKSLRSAL